MDPTTLAWLFLSLVRAHEFRRQQTPQRSRALEQDLLEAVLATIRRPRV